MKLYSLRCMTLLSIFVCAHAENSADRATRCVSDLESRGIKYVDFLFTDLRGDVRSITMRSEYVYDAIARGIFVDGSSIFGGSTINESDMRLVPDVNTVRQVPWSTQNPTAVIMCDIAKSDGSAYELDPRSMLKRQLKTLETIGYSFIVGSELELFMVDANNPSQVIDNGSYASANGRASYDSWYKGILNTLNDFGITVMKMHHEVAPGQYEIVLRHGDAISIADNITIAKYALQAVCLEANILPLFAAKPFSDANGSGMHVHFSLYDNVCGKNAFYDADGVYYLSNIARSFIAGVLEHMCNLAPFTNPTMNSYARLVPECEAPTFVCWGKKNRSALVRIPEVEADDALAVRAEFRGSDASGSAYLVFAALAAAGIEGLEKELSLAPSVDTNVYKLSTDEVEALKIQRLPSTLEDALALFASSEIAPILCTNSDTVKIFVALKNNEIEKCTIH